MTPTDPNSFNDPALRDAVRRAWSDERAPQALRDRVAAMGIGAASAPRSSVAPAVENRGTRRRRGIPFRYPRSLYGLAAAAMVLIGFALAYRLDRGPATVRQAPVGVLPAAMAQGLIDRHEDCQKFHDHRQFIDVPVGNLPALRQRLGRELGFRVLVPPLDQIQGDDRGGWQFRGGAVCPVNRVPASHLVFVRRGQSVSIFSLPRSSCPDAHGDQECEDPDPAHPIFVFVRPDGIHCVVGSSDDHSLSPARFREIVQQLRPFLNAPDPAGGRPTTRPGL